MEKLSERPDWVEKVAEVISQLQAEQLSRFLPPSSFVGRESAVLILFAESDGELEVVLTERARDLSHHPGQISFPGGGRDDTDADIVATAVREAVEEIALQPGSIEQIGLLPRLWLPVSDNAVTPVVAWWHSPHELQVLDTVEVEQVRRLRLHRLAAAESRVKVRHPSGFVGPGFQLDGWLIWGFTGGILHALLEQLGYAKPWDESREVQI